MDPNLVGVNERLQDYQRWHQQVDAWLILKVSDPAYVYRWREQAEVALRAKGGGGMTEEQVTFFVGRQSCCLCPAKSSRCPCLPCRSGSS